MGPPAKAMAALGDKVGFLVICLGSTWHSRLSCSLDSASCNYCAYQETRRHLTSAGTVLAAAFMPSFVLACQVECTIMSCKWSCTTCLLCSMQIGSTILAQAAGVPTLPWSGSGVAVGFEECHGDIPTDIYNKVSTAAAAPMQCACAHRHQVLLAIDLLAENMRSPGSSACMTHKFSAVLSHACWPVCRCMRIGACILEHVSRPLRAHLSARHLMGPRCAAAGLRLDTRGGY